MLLDFRIIINDETDIFKENEMMYGQGNNESIITEHLRHYRWLY